MNCIHNPGSNWMYVYKLDGIIILRTSLVRPRVRWTVTEDYLPKGWLKTWDIQVQ
jgi:hypothetical protein